MPIISDVLRKRATFLRGAATMEGFPMKFNCHPTKTAFSHIVFATLDQLLEMDSKDMGDEELRAYFERLQALRKKDIRQLLNDESHGRPEYQGFVYVLSNPAMPGLLKIGSTVGRPEKRARQLRTTGVPDPFKIESVFPVYVNPKEVEKKVHHVLELFRSGGDREFFRLSVEYAVAAIQSVLETTQSPKT